MINDYIHSCSFKLTELREENCKKNCHNIEIFDEPGQQWQTVIRHEPSEWTDGEQLICKLILIIVFIHLTVFTVTITNNLKPSAHHITVPSNRPDRTQYRNIRHNSVSSEKTHSKFHLKLQERHNMSTNIKPTMTVTCHCFATSKCHSQFINSQHQEKITTKATKPETLQD